MAHIWGLKSRVNRPAISAVLDFLRRRLWFLCGGCGSLRLVDGWHIVIHGTAFRLLLRVAHGAGRGSWLVQLGVAGYRKGTDGEPVALFFSPVTLLAIGNSSRSGLLANRRGNGVFPPVSNFSSSPMTDSPCRVQVVCEHRSSAKDPRQIHPPSPWLPSSGNNE